ncbi:hypothetical protein BMS3Bbin03_01048 [bacterium BMS3Bbin03]|nr:hypothetical protein BMS3Bbin03_01048 [bacterium BMS3Bbin03]
MRKELSKSKLLMSFMMASVLSVFLFSGNARSDQTKWIAIGSLHDWYSSAGSEVEVGRRHLISDQQDGLRWPAQFRYQDSKAAKALWIGTTNYNDPLVNKTFNFKVVHCGPRVLDEEHEFMPAEFKLIGKFNHPLVLVGGIPASRIGYMDYVDEVNPNLPVDRLLIDVVNTSIGVTMTRKIYAFSQKYNNNYFIYDYVFKNTGIINKQGQVNQQTLTGVVFFFQYRYAPSREGGPYGYFWLPQNSSWGRNTMDQVVGEDPAAGAPFRAEYSWHGRHSGWKGPGDEIGGPAWETDGHFGAQQFLGTVVIHADKSASDNSDDPYQPTTTWYIDSDAPINSGNDQFNAVQMSAEYAAMTKGHPSQSQADAVGNGNADEFGSSAGGYSQSQGFGPYTLAPGDSIHIVLAEGVSGLSRDSSYTIGARWLKGENGGKGPYKMPDGTTTNDPNVYKDAWVMTGKDSIYQTFSRAMQAYKSDFNIPKPPPPPQTFNVEPGGNRITLKWSNNAESWPNFSGYRIYRAMFLPDTFYQKIYECGGNTGIPLTHEFWDTTAVRGFDYYYYMTSFDDGTTNKIQPGVPLESSKFYTMTNEPARLVRAPGKAMADIRVVPNPFNIRSRSIQYGVSGADRIMFLNLPPVCTIKIFSERGDLIDTINHTNTSGDEAWNSITTYRQVVVSGIYIAVFTTPDGKKAIRKFVIIR